MVMIEHFSKWIEIAPLPCKESLCTAKAFRAHIFCGYGAPAEVLTDQGTKFRREFQELLDEALIDHRRT